jgi:hypothetical protein
MTLVSFLATLLLATASALANPTFEQLPTAHLCQRGAEVKAKLAMWESYGEEINLPTQQLFTSKFLSEEENLVYRILVNIPNVGRRVVLVKIDQIFQHTQANGTIKFNCTFFPAVSIESAP